jgi:hypothetical protein
VWIFCPFFSSNEIRLFVDHRRKLFSCKKNFAIRFLDLHNKTFDRFISAKKTITIFFLRITSAAKSYKKLHTLTTKKKVKYQNSDS